MTNSQAVPTLDVRQRNLRKKFIKIFRLVNKRINAGIAKIQQFQQDGKISDKQAEHLINLLKNKLHGQSEIDFLKVSKGFCHGITTVKLFADRLEYETPGKDAKGNVLPIDDKTWFNDVRDRVASFKDDINPFLNKAKPEDVIKLKKILAELDPTKSIDNNFLQEILELGLDSEIDHFYAKIKEYQSPTAIFSGVSQASLPALYSDTRDRVLQIEYKLTAPIHTTEDLNKVLNALAREKKLIFVAVPHHKMGMFTNMQIVDFFDPNKSRDLVFLPGDIEFDKFDQFHTHVPEENCNQYSFIVADILSKKEVKVSTQDPYPSPGDVLKTLSFTSNPSTLDYKDQTTILHMAAKIGDEESLKYFLKLNAINVNTISKRGSTALFLAAQNGFDNLVRLLIDNGAIVNLPKAKSPLLVALKNGHTKVVKILLDNGAEFILDNGVKISPQISLYQAIENNHPEIIEILLNHKVNGKQIINMRQLNDAFLHAMKRGSLETIKILLKHGALVDTNVFFTALETGNHKLVDILLDHGGIDINIKNAQRQTALQIAIIKQQPAMITTLLNRGAYVSRKTLALAVEIGNKKGLEALLTHPLQAAAQIINKPNKSGITPLQRAIENDRQDLVILLCRHGADISAVFTNQVTGQTFNCLDFATTRPMYMFLCEVYQNAFMDAIKADNQPLLMRLLNQSFEGDPIIEIRNEHILAAIKLGNEKILSLLLQHNQMEEKPVVDFENLLKEGFKQAKQDNMKVHLLCLDAGHAISSKHITWLNTIVGKLSPTLRSDIDKLKEEKSTASNARKFFEIVVRLQQELAKPKVTSMAGSLLNALGMTNQTDILSAALQEVQKKILIQVDLGLPKQPAKPGIIESCPGGLKPLVASNLSTPTVLKQQH